MRKKILVCRYGVRTVDKKEKWILSTERLYLREMNDDDFEALCKIMQDEETMYAYEGAFTDEEVHTWLERQKTRYEKDGFGLWAVCLKSNDEMIGQCGITIQNINGTLAPEIGYLFQKAFWHQGYASEAAAGCCEYAFQELHLSEICSIIRDTNLASQNVAKRNGMTVKEQFVKHYRGVDILHYVYKITGNEWTQLKTEKTKE